MAPSTRIVLVASALFVAAVSAQKAPASCTAAYKVASGCLNEADGLAIAKCICSADSTFDDQISDCIAQAGSTLSQSELTALQQLDGVCAQLNGGTSGGSSATPTFGTTPTETDSGDDFSTTPTPSGDSDSTGNPACDSFLSEVGSCITDDNASPTAAAVVSCFCPAGDDSFDDLVASCYSAVPKSDTENRSAVAAFAGYCSSYANGGNALATPTGVMTSRGGSRPTITGGTSQPTDDSSDNLSTPTSDAAGSTETTGSSGGSTKPNSASGFKATFFGSAVAALFVGVAMLL